MSSRSWSVVCAAFFTLGCSVVFDTSELLSGGPGGGGAGAAGGQGGAGAAGLGGAGAAGGQGGAGAAGGEGGNGAGSGGEGGIGPCGAGLTPCPMGCVNTLDDSEHCGACGHDCGGSGCLLGGCQAVELASFPAMHGLLLHNASDRVFFTTSNFGQHNNVVGAVSKQQGGDLEVFSVNEPASTYLALAGTSLYYTTWDQPSVRRVDLNQPGTGPNPVLSLPNPGFAIQVVGGEVVYGDYDVGLFSFEPVDVPIPSLRVAQSRIHHFLFDTENDSIVFTVAEPTSSVRRYFPNTMQLEELASADDAWDIVQDASYYYFSDQAEGTLRRIAKPASENGPTEPMADGLAGARGLALDDDYVYVVSGSVVTRVAKVPPFENTFVATAATGNQIAVDEEFIYWTNISTGKLMKIAKPL